MVAGITLVAAPLAASAHTGNLFTWAYDASGENEVGGFATISQTDASIAFLGTPATENLYTIGADICTDETSWGVAETGEPTVLFTWNHDTGELGLPVVAEAFVADFPQAEGVFVEDLWAADSLPGCVKLAFVLYSVSFGDGPSDDVLALSYVDVATGAVHPVVELPTDDDGSEIDWTGIATDPTTGFTRLFATFQSGPYFAAADLAAGEVSELQSLGGADDLFEGGAPGEADFQPDGKLWLYYEFAEGAFLLSYPAGADLTTADPTNVGEPTSQEDIHLHNVYTLTYDPKALPATGGGVPVGLLLAGGALFAGGLVLVAVRRGRTQS
jgi:hypothetical protein